MGFLIMDKKTIEIIVRQALREDVGGGDITTLLTVSPNHRAEAEILFKDTAVVCGLDFAREVLHALDPKAIFTARFQDGDVVPAWTRVVHLRGKTRAILTAERVMLNFLSYLSAIAMQTRAFVDAVKPSKVMILDTRKTTPTLRMLERYAVRVGGGVNHRFDLNGMVLLKDNHRAFSRHFGSLTDMVHHIHRNTAKRVEIEVDTLREFEEVLRAKPEMVLLDNMSAADLKKAVRIVKKFPKKHRPLLEASGGVTLKNVRKIAQTGVDRISIGSLTHSRRSIDVSLEMLG